MALKTHNPVTSSQRGWVSIDRSHLWSGSPMKSLCMGMAKTGGRNAAGRITSWHRGGGHRKVLRKIDFNRREMAGISAVVERLEHDPMRSAHIALIKYETGVYSYIIAPAGVKAGDVVMSSTTESLKVVPGNCMPVGLMPPGIEVHNVELFAGKGAQMVRSAGTSARVAGRDGEKVIIKLSSGELKFVSADCLATVGIVSNADNKNVKLGKAGRTRWMGRRPVVRGVAMNPVDHPLGGGEGKSSGGRHPCSPWGVRKGTKTRSRRKPRLHKI
jgi:large subunit ribosomal protein L2